MTSRTLNVSVRFILGLDGNRHGNGDADGDESLALNNNLAVTAMVAVASAVRTRLLLPARFNVDGNDLDRFLWGRLGLGRLDDRRRSWRLGLGLGLGLLLRGRRRRLGLLDGRRWWLRRRRRRRRRRQWGQLVDGRGRRRSGSRDDAGDAVTDDGVVGLRVLKIEPLLGVLAGDHGDKADQAMAKYGKDVF